MWSLLYLTVISVLIYVSAEDGSSMENATTTPIVVNPSSTEAIKEVTKVTPPVALPELPNLTEPPFPPRRKISYDQRQDGKYNIRADFENFMIVLIPPNAASGLNLLDVLTRSSTKRSSLKKSSKRRQSLSPKHVRKSEVSINGLHYLNRPSQLGHPFQFTEYIEGRTPYRVDISSAESDYGKYHHPDIAQQVDVIPPPYPMHLHMMKPYHLDAADPASSPVLSLPQGKLPDIFHYFDLNGRRVAKAIRDQPFDFNAFNTNRVLLNGDGRHYGSTGYRHPVGVDKDAGNKDKDSYEFKDSIQSTVNDQHIFDSIKSKVDTDDNDDDDDDVNLYQTRSAGPENSIYGNNGELLLIGATEQCGPDRKRDSYGVCQFV